MGTSNWQGTLFESISAVTDLCLVYMYMCRPVEMLLDSVLLCPINNSAIIPAGVHYIHVDIRALVAVTPYPDNRTVQAGQSVGIELGGMR